MSIYGYHNKILHINLNSKKYKIETPEKNFFRKYPGGGLLGTYILLKKTKANIDPLSSKNVLIFTNSIISGNHGPGLARFSIEFIRINPKYLLGLSGAQLISILMMCVGSFLYIKINRK